MADLFETSLDDLMGRVNDSTFHSGEENKMDTLELTKLGEVNLTVDGKSLSVEEIHQLIAFIRAKRELEKYENIPG